MKRWILPLFLCLSLLFTGCQRLLAGGASAGDPERLYQQMLEPLKNGSDTVKIKGNWSEDQLKAAYARVRNEHPDLFWLGASWAGTVQSSLLETTVTLRPAYYGTKRDNFSKHALLVAEADALAAEAQTKETVYDQILYVHDALIGAATYDTKSAAQVEQGRTAQDEVLLASTAYGCLVEKKAICSGYAAAFQLLMNRLEIPCFRVTGTADGVPHEWNVVTVDQKSYHVDLTWDDPVTGSQEERLCHDYFCITDGEIGRTHRVDEGQNLPVCDAVDLDWFAVNDMTLASYRKEEVVGILRAQADAGEERLFVKFTEDADGSVNTLVQRDTLQELARELGRAFQSYRINQAGTVVELVLA